MVDLASPEARERIARAMQEVSSEHTIVCVGGDYSGTCELHRYAYSEDGQYSGRDMVYRGTHMAVEWELEKLRADAALAEVAAMLKEE